MKRKNLFTNFSALLRRLFRKRPRRKVTYTYFNARRIKQKTYKSEQEEIDELLDKISEKGFDSLTKEEKQKLLDASHSI